MRVTILYNPASGDEEHSDRWLKHLVEDAGHRAKLWSIEEGQLEEGQLEEALERPADLVVAAGGDGTVGRVAASLAGRGLPLAIVPLGTANNISTSLGVGGDAATLVSGWPLARRRRLDVGEVQGPWGRTRFVESCGIGLLTRLMSLELADHIDNVGDARALLRRLTAEAAPVHWRVELDGEDASGEYLLVEAMNICAVGPSLRLAPDADSADGLLDLVLAGEDQRAALLEYLDVGEPVDPPRLPRRRARQIAMVCEPDGLHVDDAPQPAEVGSGPSVRVEITLLPDGVTVLVPREARD